MPDMREVFEMVTNQAEPDLDSWKEQERRHRKAARNQKLGALGVAAVIAIVTLVIGVQIANNEPKPGPVVTPPVETGSDLYVVDPETGEATLLLAARGNQTNPERSPDGARVVFVSKIAGSPPQIFVLEADGTERQLTNLEPGARDPTWSPDGRQIAFAGTGSDADIFVMNADGTRMRRLAGTPRRDSRPDWSPDGTQIAFQSLETERSHLWVASVPEGTLTRLPLRVYGGGFFSCCADPAWSPDGHWIAFTLFSPGSSGNGSFAYTELWLVRPDGTQKHRLGKRSPFGYWRQNPSWSPDGRSIVFEERIGIAIIDVETGEDSLRVLSTQGYESPSWGAEGILVSRIGSD